MTKKKRQKPKGTPEVPHAKKVKFLAAFAVCGTVTKAAEASGVDRRSHQRWVGEDGKAGDLYREQFVAAADEAADRLEEEARRRAHDGERRLKFHQGQVIMIPATDPEGLPVFDDHGRPKMVPYVEHERSDTLLIFLLNGARPQKFKRNVDVTSGGKPVKAWIDIDDGD